MDIPSPTLFFAPPRTHFVMMDAQRRALGRFLELCGFGPDECAYHVVLEGRHWRLREYASVDCHAAVLIVPAPIKRPYVWDLSPSASAVRECLDRGYEVYLVEWTPASDDCPALGILDYAGEAVSRCVAKVRERTLDDPSLFGHSLGGTFAAIYCALEGNIRSLVLLSAPLCFEVGSSRFRDSLVTLFPQVMSDSGATSGSFLSQVSALACPQAFVWDKLADAALSAFDPASLEIEGRVERWILDESSLPAKLVSEIVQLLYREDRFCRGTLEIGGQTVGPKNIEIPTLAVVDAADDVAPLGCVAPFLNAMASAERRIIEYPGEKGVGLQHLALLAGPKAHAQIWPQILGWLDAQHESLA